MIAKIVPALVFLVTSLCLVVSCAAQALVAVPIPIEESKVPKPKSVAPTTQSCPAAELQYLVGQSRRVLETMRFGTAVSIEEPGFAYPQIYIETRTRIIIGSDNKIERVLCG